MTRRYQNILAIVLFSISFGLLEAIVVIYLRYIFGAESIITSHEINSSEVLFSLGFIAFLKPSSAVLITSTQWLLTLELWREAATIIMLGTLAWGFGSKLKERLAYFLLAFAIWDIFYYLFLRILIGWPQTFLDLDIFFLIPVPWVGPVITPLVISFFMILSAVSLLSDKNKKL